MYIRLLLSSYTVLELVFTNSHGESAGYFPTNLPSENSLLGNAKDFQNTQKPLYLMYFSSDTSETLYISSYIINLSFKYPFTFSVIHILYYFTGFLSCTKLYPFSTINYISSITYLYLRGYLPKYRNNSVIF